ncbi:phosphoethanolamine--lipid A transferase [Shewanella sp. 3B26]|uniref:Phosphoethanolamine--lipid A transferase n=1 Tax=Shewanella zhuhaiensis TaxID=2919576 RepID=A0AAJ1BGV2_9GAMM|nr:phosphoethanolamine--lipid A transferase [Shewanella zhuhaiensis]MCH4294451.1 phosphoethanolamine--lipid A transferase [Shewanella zhuhaiensis]
MKSIGLNRFTFFVALYYALILNIPLYIRASEGLKALSYIDWLFVASLPVLLTCLLAFIFSLFSFKYLAKPFFMGLTLLSASVVYGMYKYGIVFDRAMMENIFETHSAEALMYVNAESIIGFALLGILPAVLIFKAPIEYRVWWKELLHKLGFMAAMLACAGAILGVYYQDYVAFGRNNDDMKQLIVPTYFMGAAGKYLNQRYFETPLVYQPLGEDAKNETIDSNQKPLLTVLVVGETARSMNYQYYGYQKDTNAHTKPYNPVVFDDVSSCGTATAQSLPCMFSRMSREEYDARRARAQDSAIDVLSHAGIQVNWIDNDSGCKGVCDRVSNELIALNDTPELCDGESCLDEVLLRRLDSLLEKGVEKDTLVVLHIMGSHGPTYYQRYPEAHRAYTPDCPRSDIQNCSNEALVNTYDNTIRYSDYIIAEVMKRLVEAQSRADTALMYISDHGESLGEKGLYLHGAPYAFAPKEQISIPWFVWHSPGFIKENQIDEDCLRGLKGPWSHDNLFDSLLGWMNVKTDVYQQDMDIFARCRAQ